MAKKEYYTPPASLEAEQAVIGSCLIMPSILEELVGELYEQDFYSTAHQIIYHAIVDLHGADIAVDLVTVCQYLRDRGQLEKVGGPVYLAGLSEATGFATNFLHYGKTVRQKAILRRLLDATQRIASACLSPMPPDEVDGFIDAAESEIYQIRDNREGQVSCLLDDVVVEEVGRIEELFERKREILGVPSGFMDLDKMTAGWQGGDLIILAARPAVGKTAMSLNMAHYAANIAVPTAFFSLEQPKGQLVQRLLASTGRINSSRLRSARMESDEWGRFNEAAGKLMGLPFHIIDKPAMATLEIRSQARRLKSKYGIALVVVDYLQLIRDPKARSREQEVGGISRNLKALAKELDVPVIALCQLNREVEKRPNKKPVLSDLRESGSLEADADVVILLYRDEVYKGEDSKEAGVAEIHVAKQRNGPTGRIRLAYLKEFMLFQNYTESLF